MVLPDRSRRSPYVYCLKTEQIMYALPPFPLHPQVPPRINLGHYRVPLVAKEALVFQCFFGWFTLNHGPFQSGWTFSPSSKVRYGTPTQLSCSCGHGLFSVPLTGARWGCPKDHKQCPTHANHGQKWRVFSSVIGAAIGRKIKPLAPSNWFSVFCSLSWTW